MSDTLDTMLRAALKEAKMWLDNFVVPRLCPVCGEPLQGHLGELCFKCLAALPVCHARGPELIENRAALSNMPFGTGIVAAWFNYDPADPYAGLIRSAKYHDRPILARHCGALFARELLQRGAAGSLISPSDIAVLLPMPMFFAKQLKRGYNQSREIALGMAGVLGIPVGDNLVAVRPHGSQTRLSYNERAANIHGCYRCRHPEELERLNVAIVDDVITTGASMGEAISALAWGRAKPSTVSVLALGATVKGS